MAAVSLNTITTAIPKSGSNTEQATLRSAIHCSGGTLAI